jgi:hypothetical protein
MTIKRFLSCCAAALAVLASAAAADKEPARNIDELMHKSGLWMQIAQMEPVIQAGIAEERSQAKAKGDKNAMSDADHARLKAAAATAYAADRLREDVRSVLASELAPEDESKVLEWLSSESGKRITAIEEGASEVAEMMKREQAAAVLLPTLSASRVDKLKRLARSLRVGDSTAGMIINTTLGMVYGIALATPPHETGGIDALKKRFETQRPQMARSLEERSIGEFAVIYRSLPDDELEGYVAFSESASGRRYNDASVVAVDQALVRAAVNMGIEFGAKSPRENRKS